ncbi:hypothetical protein [Chitinophaga sancti]|uniref:hypothetical protein n=1 Tax=Chitinophaga sancti TaxID=1004 RepID=UPI003F7B343D
MPDAVNSTPAKGNVLMTCDTTLHKEGIKYGFPGVVCPVLRILTYLEISMII